MFKAEPFYLAFRRMDSIPATTVAVPIRKSPQRMCKVAQKPTKRGQ